MFVTVLALVVTSGTVSAGVTVKDISPDDSELYKKSSAGFHSANSSGGRVNNLASVVGVSQNLVFYAASEWGGLSKSEDGGRTWDLLPGHVPMVTEDVAVDRVHPNIVYATSRYDGRVDPHSGLQVSHDEGVTWIHPATAVPRLDGSNTPAGFRCASPTAIDEPAAFGIGIRPDATGTVVVGTNCGLAISNDSGATWRFRDPWPSNPAQTVWDVVVQPGGTNGIIDICGDEGHWRSVDGGEIWTGGAMWWLPGSKCSIAVSPDEQDVVFITALVDDQIQDSGACLPKPDDTDPECYFVHESDDGGASWNPIGGVGRPPDSVAGPKNRIPFVVTNQRSDLAGVSRFDLWFGDEGLFRVSCQSPPKPGSYMQQRCDPPSAWFPVALNVTYHGDMGDIEFNPTQASDACPVVVASDGGTFYLDPADPAITDCQSPQFKQPERSVHALWLWGMDGANQPGDTVDLYFGTQDVGPWATDHAEVPDPSVTWRDDVLSVDADGGDAQSVAADPSRVVYWFTSGGGLYLQEPGMTGSKVTVPLPSGCGPELVVQFAPAVARYAEKAYVILCPFDKGVYRTRDVTAPVVQWTRLGEVGENLNGCAIRASVSPTTPSTPVFYVQNWLGVGDCLGNEGNGLYKYEGDEPNQAWQRIDTNPVIAADGATALMTGGIGIFGVDPVNANRLYASNLRDTGPRMVFSENGGATWQEAPELDRLMTANGLFRYRNESGPTTGSPGYPQPSLVAFDPEDPNILVAGARDSGVFISTNAGRDWSRVTDPIDPGRSGIPHIPRPWFSHFHHTLTGALEVYLGTQGRGVWRISIVNQPPVCDADGPYRAECLGATTSVTLDGTGSSDPDGDPLNFEWTGPFLGGTATSATPSVAFPETGQFTVNLKVRDQVAVDTCSAEVEIVDTLPPTVACSVAIATLWPPNHDLVDVGLSAGATDVCGGELSVEVEVFSNEDDDETSGADRFSPDAKRDPLLRLRSERRDNEDGRVYLVRSVATDPAGNTDVDCCTISVPTSLNPSDTASVIAQANAAEAACDLDGTIPAGFVLVGDGPTLGPKQ